MASFEVKAVKFRVKALVHWFDNTDQHIVSVGEVYNAYVKEGKTCVTFPNGEEVVIGFDGKVWNEWEIVE